MEFEVRPVFVVDEDTANMALKIVEWHANATGKELKTINYADGTVGYYWRKHEAVREG